MKSEVEVITGKGKANAAVFKNPLDTEPAHTFEFEAGCTVSEWLETSGFRKLLCTTPTLVLLNNVALLEADWDTVINEHDVVTLVPQPGIADWIIYVGFAVSVLSASYALYLALTIDTPDAGGEAQSSTYSISYRGNHKRPNQPIPVSYGKCRVYPDISSETWSIYDDSFYGEQVMVMLFEFTQGAADITDMMFEETPFANYQGLQYEVLQPGQASTIYPWAVENSENVSSIELDATATTAYFICGVGELAGGMMLDFSAPQGLWTRSPTTGKYYDHAVGIDIEYRLEGAGSWTLLHVVMPSRQQPLRRTTHIDLALGRYEVKVKRNLPRVIEDNTADKVYWTGLRANLHSTSGAPQTTRVAVRVRSSDQLGNLALTQFSGICHRKLPRWTGSSWTAPELTTSPVWAFCDTAMANYGGKRPESYLDLDALLALETRFGSTRQFNGIFETSIPLWQALQEIARTMLARPIEQTGGRLTMVVDEEASGPSAMFTMASIERGSFKLDTAGYTSETNDSVTITYKDEAQEYRDTSATFIPDGSSGLNPAERSLRGVTSLAGAELVGWRMANENRYRRITATWKTGIEGYVPTYGDTVRVQHWMLGVDLGNTTLSGSIISKSGSTMYVHEDLSGIGGSGLCYITGSAGGVKGPYSCSVSTNSFTVSGGDTSGVTFSDNLQRPQFIVGKSGDFVAMVKLTGLQNVGEHLYELTGFLDNTNAYNQDEPAVSTTLGAAAKLTPTIEDLRYELDREGGAYNLRLSWREINVDRSRVEQSIDNAATYDIIDEQAHQSYTRSGLDPALVDSGNLWYRVTGYNIGAGPSASINIGTQTYTVASPTGVVLVGGEFVEDAVIGWDAPPINHRAKVDVWWDAKLQRTEIFDRAVTQFAYNWFRSVYDQSGTYLGARNSDNGARDVTFYVSILDDGDSESATVQVDAHNDQVGALQNVFYWELLKGGLRVQYQRPNVEDFFGVEIHLSKTQGFTPDMTFPGSTTRKYAGPQDDITIAGNDANPVLAYPDTYYMRIAGVDAWGRDNLTWSLEEVISTTDGVTEGSVDWTDLTTMPGIGVKMNRSTFDGGLDEGRYYLHGFAQGAAADVDLNVLLAEDYAPIARHAGYCKHNGRGFIAYYTGDVSTSPWTVNGAKSKYAYIFWWANIWFYDNNVGPDYVVVWDPDSFKKKVFGLAEVRVENNIAVEATSWSIGLYPSFIVGLIIGLDWNEIFGDGKPDDGAQVNNPSPLGFKINTKTFGNAPDAGYFYLHGYSGGVPVDAPAQMLCGNGMVSIPSGPLGIVGVAKFTGQGYIAYDIGETEGFFTIEGLGYNLAAVGFIGGAWYYDNGGSLIQWIPPAVGPTTGVYLIAGVESAGTYVVDISPWSVGQTPQSIAASDHTGWPDIYSRPTDEDLLNEHQEWLKVNNIPAGVYNDTIIWDDLADLQGTNNELYNSDTTWVNLGAVDTGTPEEILNENVLYAGLSDAPNASDIYNDQQYYSDIVDLKPPVGATQNGQRGLSFDPDFGLSHAAGSMANYYELWTPNITTDGNDGENGTAAAIMPANGANTYFGSSLISVKQGDRFYCMARIKLSSGSMYTDCHIYIEEYGNLGRAAAPTGGSASNSQGAVENTTAWQTVLFVADITAAATEYICVQMLIGSALSSGTMTVDSFDWWPITVKWTYPNIGYYIDNLAIREALIGNAAITNLKVKGDTLFLPAYEYWPADDNPADPIYLGGITAVTAEQYANWKTFAVFYFDMNTMAAGQDMIVHKARSAGFSFALDSSVDKVWLDVRVVVNDVARALIYQSDWESQALWGGDFSHPVTAGTEYRCGRGWDGTPSFTDNRERIEVEWVEDAPRSSPPNKIEFQFRLMCKNSSNVSVAVTGDYIYSFGKAVIAGGRS